MPYLRWHEWGLLQFYKQTPSYLAAIGTLNSIMSFGKELEIVCIVTVFIVVAFYPFISNLYLLLKTMINPFPNSTIFLKTLWEKKKLLVTHSVFYSFVEISAIFIKFEIVVCKLLQSGPVQNLLFGKGLSCSLEIV